MALSRAFFQPDAPGATVDGWSASTSLATDVSIADLIFLRIVTVYMNDR
jgi:hypothetical protein